jgi:type II pantothenate kinase
MKCLIAEINNSDKIRAVAISGGGSRRIGHDLMGFKVRKVDEIQAIGLGGLTLTGKSEGLVVSVGTGTALVAVFDKGNRVEHVGGTGIGGGTVMGLSRRMLGIDDFFTIENLALQGVTLNVDLSVMDVTHSSVGIVSGEATASNFGRLDRWSDSRDVAAGILNMVSQVVGVISAMAGKACGLEDHIIFVGNLLKSDYVSNIVREAAELFGAKVCVPKDCEYAVALGAVKHVALSGYGK